MKHLIIFLFFFNTLSAQKYLNDDGTLSSHYHREIFIATLKENESQNDRYEIEDEYLVNITKINCSESISEKELQENAFKYCILQLITRIRVFQKIGFKELEASGFSGLIIKTNFICLSETRRYHFKFNIKELKTFPEFIDIKELLSYIEANNNKNVIYIKNNK